MLRSACFDLLWETASAAAGVRMCRENRKGFESGHGVPERVVPGWPTFNVNVNLLRELSSRAWSAACMTSWEYASISGVDDGYAYPMLWLSLTFRGSR